MGTRCDFYVGRGETAEWLGSYPWDGHPGGIPNALLAATTEPEFRAAVTTYLAAGERSSTLPEHGWPWPWDSSSGTDYAYAFDAGTVYGSSFGRAWFVAKDGEPDHDEDTCPKCSEGDQIHTAKVAVFPNMSAHKKTTFGPRSGLIVLGGY